MTIFHEKNYQLFFFLFHYYWLNKFLRNVKIYSGAPPTAAWMGFSIVKLCIAKSYKWFLDFAKYNNFTSKSSQTKLRFLFYPRMNHLLKAFFMTEFQSSSSTCILFFSMHRLDYRAGNISYFTNVSLIFHKYYSYASTDHKSKANIKAKIKSILHWCQGFGPIRGPGVLWAMKV